LLVHFFMNVNAILGIVEYLTGFRLTPPSAELGSFAVDWRSTALFGHPLANASMAGAYALALAVGGGRDLPAFLRPLAIALQSVALVTFGGRAALVTALILLAGVAILRLIHILRGGRFNIVSVAVLCFAIPLVATASIVAAQAGFFDQLLARFVSDEGSASTRIIMFRLFDILPLRDIILGPDLDTLASIQYQEGIDYGIESFWIGFILTDGLAISLIFFAGLAAFCWDLVRVTRPATSLLLFFFFVVASTSVSLSVKTPLFAMLIVLLLGLMRHSRPERKLAGARR
ncbi:MAG TPA: VpsF family polysaccharide biosynthesis protein, partial [Beijerinckiaceae bacterium]|nr:VpsF family polysaccharide biosynthesis protein [Beijerinckiaceae bacterium]